MEWRRVCNGILACILVGCLGYDAWSLVRRTEARLDETVQADWRKAGRLVSEDDSVALLVKDDHVLRPVERTRLLALNWNLLLASALLAAHGCARSVCAAGVASALFMVGMCCALSFNRTSYFEWMASNCIPRLVWTILAVILSGVTATRQTARKELASQ